MSPENLAKNAPFVELLARGAAENDATPAQIARARVASIISKRTWARSTWL
jgi:hypothetical protein